MSDSDPLFLAYAHLNLRYNPFGRLSAAEKSAFEAIQIDLEHYTDRLKEPGFAIQFLREGTSGKTTHLLALRRRFPGAPYVCVTVQDRTPTIPKAPVLFIDQMQRMPRARRIEILRRPASFAIVSHMNHEHEFKRARLTYELIKLSGLDVERLHESINKRIIRARRSEDLPVPTVSVEACASLISRFGDSLLAIHTCLYDLFQEMTEVSDVKNIDGDPVRQT
jgi:hypothetical protein